MPSGWRGRRARTPCSPRSGPRSPGTGRGPRVVPSPRDPRRTPSRTKRSSTFVAAKATTPNKAVSSRSLTRGVAMRSPDGRRGPRRRPPTPSVDPLAIDHGETLVAAHGALHQVSSSREPLASRLHCTARDSPALTLTYRHGLRSRGERREAARMEHRVGDVARLAASACAPCTTTMRSGCSALGTLRRRVSPLRPRTSTGCSRCSSTGSSASVSRRSASHGRPGSTAAALVEQRTLLAARLRRSRPWSLSSTGPWPPPRRST